MNKLEITDHVYYRHDKNGDIYIGDVPLYLIVSQVLDLPLNADGRWMLGGGCAGRIKLVLEKIDNS